MKVLFVSHYAQLHGAPRSMISLICELKKMGVSSLVVLPEHGILETELKKNDIDYCIVEFKRCYYGIKENVSKVEQLKNEIFNLKAVFQLAGIIKKHDIDIVHSNSHAVDVGAFAAYLTGTPHVWHFREFMKEDFDLVHNIKWKERWLAKKSQAVIAVSKAVKSKYAKAYRLKNIKVIYNGIDAKYIIDEGNPLSDSCLKMLISGTVCEGKGQREAIAACKILLERGYNNFQLYIAGSGNIKYFAELKRERNKGGLFPYVKFLWFQSDMNFVRQKADVELVCSVCEAFGRVTIEAMMADLLVIGANTGGTKELIQDGVNGILYQQGDAVDLANKIERVMQNRDRYVGCVRNGKAYAINNFNISITAQKVFKIYQRIIKDIS